MTGICSYGGYVPRYRLDRKPIYKAMGWINPATIANARGEKAVANYDEDSLTMAVAAGQDALSDIGPEDVDGLYFASTSMPYAERHHAVIAAAALGLGDDIRTADFAASLKAGTTALRSALDGVTSRQAARLLVCASDCRLGKPGSSQEMIFGDGAAALLVGSENVVAEFKGAFSVAHDFPDHWRSANERCDRQWEDRFIRDEGYGKFILEALNGLLNKCGLAAGELSKVVYPCLYPGDFKKIAKVAGLSPEQIEEPLLGQVGFTGTADPILHFVKALETARPGDRIAVVSYGNGADAILFEVTDRIDSIREHRRGVAGNLAARRELTSYEKMITWSGQLPVEKGIRGETTAFTALSDLWRSRSEVLGLCGSQCQSCDTPQFPVQRVCANPECGAIDQMKSYRFADKKGSLFTYTGDNLAFTLNPPAIYGMVEFDGGGRFWFDITDVDLDNVEVGMPVEMSFRKKYVDEKFGIHGYFWKAVPVQV